MFAHVICHRHCAVNIFKKMNIDMYIHVIISNNPHAYKIHFLFFFSRQYSKTCKYMCQGYFLLTNSDLTNSLSGT